MIAQEFRTSLKLPAALANSVSATQARFVLTGATGWIGRSIIEMIAPAFGSDVASRVELYGTKARDLELSDGLKLAIRPIDDIAKRSGPAIFLHCAFLTKDRVGEASNENYIAANHKLSDLVATGIGRSETCGLFVPSSGAVYRRNTRELDTDIDANPYGVLKYQDERRFLALAEGKYPLSLPRVFNLAGPFINKLDTYALASMISAALAGQNITIRAAHRVVRSYIHITDLIKLMLSMLLNPQPDDQAVFDTAGAENLELGKLAEQILKVLNRPDLKIERPDLNGAKDDLYVGDRAALDRLMVAHGLTGIDMTRQIDNTASYIASLKSNALHP